MININKPHYLLFCEGSAGPSFGFPQDDASRWRFVLENVETGHKAEAWDYEEILHPDRISLMAVIRGLEALDQPSKVTLVTTNRYVARGLQYGLTEWRENDFCWEHFGSIQPIRNQDLWRRVDVALRYHEVTCRWMAYDAQQDRIDGDRRDVPVETLASRESQSVYGEEKFEQATTVRSRTFSAATQLADELLYSRSKPTYTSVSGETPNHYSESNVLESAVLDKCSVDSEPHSESSTPSESKRMRGNPPKTILSGPLTWMWRCLLRIDTMLVYAVRIMLLMDPKSDSYRARQ